MQRPAPEVPNTTCPQSQVVLKAQARYLRRQVAFHSEEDISFRLQHIEFQSLAKADDIIRKHLAGAMGD